MVVDNIKQFVRFELSGWRKKEILIFLSIYLFIIFNAIITNDSLPSVFSAICGISYTIIAGKGKISCYFFGLMGSLLYVYLSVKNTIWGNAILYGFYYIPMEIIGLFAWSKHLDKKQEIKKTKLENTKIIKLSLLSFLASIFIIIGLYYFKDSHSIIDGVTMVLSIVGMYLTVRRCIEQWIVWMIVNALSMIMWINIVINGERAYSTVIMWLIYFVMAIYFYKEWKKSL